MAQGLRSGKLEAVSEVTCFACEREPTQQCPRCGRPYCEEHGEDFCNVCLEPSSGVPSFTLYRGSLLALLMGAALAVWLIIQPTGDSTESAFRPREVTATAQVSGAGNLTTPLPGTQAAGGATTPAATQGAGTGATSTRAPTSTTPGAGTTPAAGTTPGASGEYVVVSGDTLSGICSDKIRRPTTMTVPDCVAAVRSLNSLTSDNLEIGQRLRVPQ